MRSIGNRCRRRLFSSLLGLLSGGLVLAGCSGGGLPLGGGGAPIRFVFPKGFRGIVVVRADPAAPEMRPGADGTIELRFVPGTRAIRVRDFDAFHRLHAEDAFWEGGTPIPIIGDPLGTPGQKHEVGIFDSVSDNATIVAFVGTRAQYAARFNEISPGRYATHDPVH